MTEPDLLDMIRALGRLSEDEREAFIDHHLVGRSYREIGDDLGVGGERVRQIINGATRKLADILDPMEQAA